ncbi:MAG: hypothetical protein GYA51_09445 [Candidatus Methanofastidiosa archaeon]|nr:hypothetical protein [Candidatus Methanofastidiosa archaeon]
MNFKRYFLKKLKFEDNLKSKMPLLKLSNNQNHKILVIWATDCTQRVLPYFEDIHINDNRPRKAIKAGRVWDRGEITVNNMRQATLAAHATAREANNQAAEYAARAADQAASTAHVTSHAVYAVTYAVKAVFFSSDPGQAYACAAKERHWQLDHLL